MQKAPFVVPCRLLFVIASLHTGEAEQRMLYPVAALTMVMLQTSALVSASRAGSTRPTKKGKEPSMSKPNLHIRQGRQEDIEPILDLLTEYELPRQYFEPFYLNDSSYRPEQSWVVEQHGRLLSHLRIFDRWLRLGQAHLHVAGIGNVITAREARGQGYFGAIMRAMLPSLNAQGYLYSLLWTPQPTLYNRYGWVSLPQERTEARMPSHLSTTTMTPFRERDLPIIMQIYETNNAERTGPFLRSARYWQQQRAWLHEKPAQFLVAHDTAMPLGYIRSRKKAGYVEVLEIGMTRAEKELGRALLSAVTEGGKQSLRGHFPPSIQMLFQPEEYRLIPEESLMGRVIDLSALLRLVQPLWQTRLQAHPEIECTFSLSTSAGQATVRVSRGSIQWAEGLSHKVPLLQEHELAHLLFRGVDRLAEQTIDQLHTIACLPVLFPAQDFVIWPSDAF